MKSRHKKLLPHRKSVVRNDHINRRSDLWSALIIKCGTNTTASLYNDVISVPVKALIACWFFSL